MNRFFAIVLFITCAFAAYHFTLERGFVNPYPVVCDLVSKKIYLDEDDVKKWHRICLRRQRLVTPYSPKKLVIKDINNALGLLNVSHLEVYDAAAVKSAWTGESRETGIVSEFVDSELVVFKVHANSPAAVAGLKRGDIILTINGEQPNPWEAQSESGQYLIERGSKKVEFTITAKPIVRAEGVQFEVFNKGLLVQVPSFRASFFSDDKMKELEEKFTGVKRLVIDLRGNVGGNFVAGLRFLSLLMCEPKEVGRLIRPRFPQATSSLLPDDLRDEKQLLILDKNREVLLKTYSRNFCYKGELRVLVDGKTASVAEMVAQALKEFRRAPLLGNPSRGQLLVGVWYPLDEIGKGVEISIPEAYYLSSQKHRIEGQGVELDKVLYYDLQEMQNGTDSWVRKALD